MDNTTNGGAKEDRTPDLLRARQALSQLSYGPKMVSYTLNPFRSPSNTQNQPLNSTAFASLSMRFAFYSAVQLSCSMAARNVDGKTSFGSWWVWEDLNLRPHPYQGCALTN